MESGANEDVYLPEVVWHPDSKRLVIARLDRLQTILDLLLCSAATGECNPVITERDPRWINLLGPPEFIEGGKEFLWLSERSGYSHIYRIGLDGQVKAQVTSGKWVVTSIDAIDEKKGELDLIVDDVYTTGGSIKEARNELGWDDAVGIVLFARTPFVPDWIIPIFKMSWSLDEAPNDKDSPYIINDKFERVFTYNPDYGDNRICVCGHEYHRHFDSYPNMMGEVMEPVGCKYCPCYRFTEDKDPKKGLHVLLNQLEQFFNSENIKYIDCIKKPFDHTLHDAKATVNSSDSEENIIIEEIKKGYMVDDYVIRPSHVVVTKKKCEEETVNE